MKRISLITIHLGSNFGSILQAIATVNMFKEHQCSVVIVNYIPDRCTWKRFFIRALKSPTAFIKSVIMFPIEIINKHLYNSFLAKYANVSKPIYSNDDFVKACPKADVYVTGSDQVWNSIHNEGLDKRYYFEGFPENVTKVAYSSSIGREDLNEGEYLEMKRMLGTYKAISVREASAKTIIESMGYKVCHLLDPTFMLDKAKWSQYRSKRIVKEPYIMVYLPYNTHDKNLIYKSVRVIAQCKKLKVVTFSWTIRPEKLADRTVYFADPGDFLSLMDYADYIVTNSFHGTAFSINLNKQFYVYLPTGFGTRIMSILNLCSLSDRLLKADEVVSVEKVERTIDYNSINSILNRERKLAHEFLDNALN